MPRSPQGPLDGNSADRVGSIGIELDLFVVAIHPVQIMNVQQVSAYEVEPLQAPFQIEAGLVAQIESVSIGRQLVLTGV